MGSFIDFTIPNKEILRYGEDVDLEVYSSESYSDYGDQISATTTIYGVKAIFNTYGQRQNFVTEGQFNETKYSFFFKGDQVGVDVDNVIVRANGERWKIVKATNHAIQGRTYVSEAAVSNG